MREWLKKNNKRNYVKAEWKQKESDIEGGK